MGYTPTGRFDFVIFWAYLFFFFNLNLKLAIELFYYFITKCTAWAEFLFVNNNMHGMTIPFPISPTLLL